MTLSRGQWSRVALVATAALAISACESNGSYRVASVGASSAGAPQDDSGSGTDTAGNGGSGSGSNGSGSGSGGSTAGGQGNLGQRVLVASGNAVIGAAGTQANATAGIPGAGLASATVTGALTSTGQTLVELGNGSTLVLGGKGGKIGDVVSIDFGKGKVVGGPSGSPLIGANVLARNPTTGRLATIGGSNGNLVSVTNPGIGTGGLLGRTGATAGPTGNATAGRGSVGTVVNGVVKPGGGVNVNAVTNAVTKPVTGIVNVNGAVTPPKPPK